MTVLEYDEMIETYQETIYRFRVMRKMNDELRNPEGEWDLVYSTTSRADAERVMEQEMAGDRKFEIQDDYRVVDAGRDTVIERQLW